MKASIVFLGFDSSHKYRDSGLILSGLSALGVGVKMITLAKEGLASNDFPFEVMQVKNKNVLTSADFWKHDDSDFVIFYTWLGARKFYYDAVVAMKSANKFVFIKSDSHGRIGFPVTPVFLSIFCEKNFLISMLRLGVRFLPAQIAHKWRLEYLKLVDATIIESPEAFNNLAQYMEYWGLSRAIQTTNILPNPVADMFIAGNVPYAKKNKIVCVGRWDDTLPKNTTNMIHSVIGFLQQRQDYTAVIIGGGNQSIKQVVAMLPKRLSDRIEITGVVDREEIQKHLLESKIAFLASRWEGFSIFLVEALCSGCSVVSSPITCAKSVTMGGYCGTLATSLQVSALSRALNIDASKWDTDFYPPKEISEIWKKKVNKDLVAEEIVKIYESRNK